MPLACSKNKKGHNSAIQLRLAMHADMCVGRCVDGLMARAYTCVQTLRWVEDRRTICAPMCADMCVAFDFVHHVPTPDPDNVQRLGIYGMCADNVETQCRHVFRPVCQQVLRRVRRHAGRHVCRHVRGHVRGLCGNTAGEDHQESKTVPAANEMPINCVCGTCLDMCLYMCLDM